ncbi:hypothetical protein ALO68_200122 [Pseudomonas syringae pv. helianthi]|uniref:Uncharacterized protein n=2 Tax=Pseudomonas syringae group TaxID=136849 RepID=A0A0P9RQL6_9PSED|nr:hypothetical protein ALO68_200122 [Pseudomonas syringae pv. helianthi]RMN54977.1 hypothetical protein ALQ57_200019 [Pseudomonas amygdali pv. hibisci]RMR09654.1 hypothetical protein ALP93_200391 [Pseudomonas syringae pv. helianthi]
MYFYSLWRMETHTMAMKFGRAHCEELKKLLSPYQARDLYTNEDGEHYAQELTFLCEDQRCRALLTPVGVYMARKSKRALHFRTKDSHASDCDFLQPGASSGPSRSPAGQEDDFKPSDFPTELDLSPCPRKGATGGGETTTSGTYDETGSSGATSTSGGSRRKTSTRTRYLDLVVDCYLSEDNASKNQLLTIADKTKTFSRFFKNIQYFQDETGLIYHGLIDDLRLYAGKGVGLRFTKLVWVDKKRYRIWAYVPQERIDESRRRKAFLKEIDELEKAIKAGEQVHAFFVGAYPLRSTVENRDGSQFEVYRAELLSIDHLSLVFAEPNRR